MGILLICLFAAAALAAPVDVQRVPHGGIQPQVAVDAKGTLHLIYFTGDPGAGDVFYVRRAATAKAFTPPIRVNSHPGSVIATGTVRGAHLALGRNGRVHVAWMGSKAALPRGPEDAAPMLYTRSNPQGTAFEPQRNVLQFAAGLDGGGSLAADAAGHVYVAWHGGEHGGSEDARHVYVARSTDDGKTFARETPAIEEQTGSCACCGMRAFAAGNGNNAVYMLYRGARERINRDMYLLASLDGGQTFRARSIHRWDIGACPMSTASFAEGGSADAKHTVVAAWETEWQVYFAAVNAENLRVSEPVPAPGETGKRKHPAVARNSRDETILVWTEGTGFRKGGSLAWQVFDASGKPTREKGTAPDVPASSLAAVYARPDGTFVIVH